MGKGSQVSLALRKELIIMDIMFIKKMKINLTAEELMALRTASKILANIENEISDNEIEDELDEIIGISWDENYQYCSYTPSELINAIINLVNE